MSAPIVPASALARLEAIGTRGGDTPYFLVSAICDALTKQEVQLSPGRALLLSAAGFRIYAFSPDDNHGFRHDFPNVEFLQESLHLDSYGITESIGAHVGRDLRRYDSLSARQAAELLRNELDTRTPPVVFWNHDFWVCVGLESTRDFGEHATLRLRLPSTSPSGPKDVDLDVDWVSDRDFIICIRELGESFGDGNRRSLLLDALRHGRRHWRSGKELDYRRELFVASGARAYDVLDELVSTRWQRATHGTSDGSAPIESLQAYLKDVGRDVFLSRRGTARGLAEILDLDGERLALSPSAILAAAAGFSAVSDEWGRIFDALERPDWADSNRRAALSGMLLAAKTQEAQAHESLHAGLNEPVL